MKQYYLFFFFLISSLSFSQVDDIVRIFDIPIGLSMESVKEKWGQNNMNDYASLFCSTDDVLKYEGKRDSLMLGCIFYFVDDSLYSFSFWSKLTLIKTRQLLKSVKNNFGEPDSTAIKDRGNETKGNLREYPLVYWSRINNSFDNINVSHAPFIEGLNLFTFNKYNTILSEKARSQKKHRIKL